MFCSNLVDRLLSVYEQIVIYGAKGWIGRSAVSLVSDQKTDWTKKQILLVGSKSEFFVNSGELLQIYSAQDAVKYLSKNCIFLNAAYLRREKLDLYSKNEFIQKNKEIIEFGERILRQKKVETFINFSSGVAGRAADLIEDTKYSIYAKCKIDDEVVIKNASDSASSSLINCRVFSLSGRHLNEFENLALSLFIKQATTKPRIIMVKSKDTYRTYLDSINLVEVLLGLSLTRSSYMIDSGGFLIKLGHLADKIATIIPAVSVNKSFTPKDSSDYYGNFEMFNELAAKLGTKLLNIEDQINETLKAFNDRGL
jgi:nucleoside-diphosphate-sugar epimerase